MAENYNDDGSKLHSTCTHDKEREHSDIQALLDSLHVLKERLQEASLLTSTEFYMLCKHLDNVISTTAVNTLPEDLRLSLNAGVCDFISATLTGKLLCYNGSVNLCQVHVAYMPDYFYLLCVCVVCPCMHTYVQGRP